MDTVIRKLLITPWFGPEPPWMDYYWRNADRLHAYGYDWLVRTDLPSFKHRVQTMLDVDCPITHGSSKIHDYRATFGVLYQDMIHDYDFWGHTDFDMVYGRVQEYVTDAFLSDLDIHSNHVNYIAGPWTLYRNCTLVNELFMEQPDWRAILETEQTTGWVEKEFTQIVDAHHEAGDLRRVYTMWQTRDLNDFSTVHFEDGRLMEGREEIMCAHFRRTKQYPEGCK